MSEIIGLEAQAAPTAADERVGFAVTHVRPTIVVQFPVDEEPEDEASED